jgi:hypothetical protein
LTKRFIQVKLTKVSCIRTLFNVWFLQDFGLFRVRFRQVSLYVTFNHISVIFCVLYVLLGKRKKKKNYHKKNIQKLIQTHNISDDRL